MSDKIKRGVAFPPEIIKAIEAKAKKGQSFGSVVVQVLKKALGIK